MDFAAWMEVYLGDRWWTFDPRNNERRKGRVLIGRGRDAGDVAMATTFGAPHLESMKVIAEEVVEPSGRAPSRRSTAQDACRLATVRSSTWFSSTSPIGTAPKNMPQSSPSRTTTKMTRSPGKASPGAGDGDVGLDQPPLPAVDGDGLAAPVGPGGLRTGSTSFR